MLDAIVLVVLGMVIGWHVPQPAWAKVAIDFVLGYVKPLLKPVLDKLLAGASAVKSLVVGSKKKKK